MKSKSLNGKRFGRLVVLEELDKSYLYGYRCLCLCDCGKTKKINSGSLRYGATKSCGCYQKEICRKNMLNENNPVWKGDQVGAHAVHAWIRARKPKPSVCESCKKYPPHDLANISQEYKRDINDFKWLCRQCHMTEDGRIDQRNSDGTFKRIM